MIMFVLSRWAGGLIAQYGAKLPLVLGPLITAGGYALLARPGVGGPYWSTYFPAMVLLGFGMAMSVAPLTTLIMTSVDQKRAGAASGINNAVSQTAALLAIAICSPLFYQSFSHSLPHNLQRARVSPHVTEQVELQKRHLGAISTQDAAAKSSIDESFVGAFRLIALLASFSAAVAGITAAVTIRDDQLVSGRAQHL
jgi:MFS family permease